MTLAGRESEFADYPIYLKATGGMRELSFLAREKILDSVKSLLSDKQFCPFFFREDFARVISGWFALSFRSFHVLCIQSMGTFVGEEEAIYSWAATNFLVGNLLPASQGTGVVTDGDLNSSYGTLDLGHI